MFYKIKINKNSLRFLEKVEKVSKPKADEMFLTEEEFMLLNPAAVEDYPLTQEGIPVKRKGTNQ